MNVKRDDFMTSFYMCTILTFVHIQRKGEIIFCTKYCNKIQHGTFELWSTPSNRGIIILIWRYTNEHY
jgi:hypothetical protein